MIFGVNLTILIGDGFEFSHQFLAVLEDIDHIPVALLVHREELAALAVDELDVQLGLQSLFVLYHKYYKIKARLREGRDWVIG